MSLFHFQIEKPMVRVKHILQFSYYIWIYIQFHEKNMYVFQKQCELYGQKSFIQGIRDFAKMP